METKNGSRWFKIYALVDGQTIFIGKTQGKIDSVYYQHRRAQNRFTAKYFYPPNSRKPSMHILEDIVCSHSTSYRHIVAWVRIFQDAGYEVINPKGTLDDAHDLKTPTLNLINNLRPRSIDTLLSETLYCKQSTHNASSSSKEVKANVTSSKKTREKITLWATPEEKEDFVFYAKSLGLTQTQTLRYLMSKAHLIEEDSLVPNLDNDLFIRIMRDSYRLTIEEKDHEIHKLKMALYARSQDTKYEAKKRNECCTIAQKSLCDFYDLFDSSAVLPLDIERGKYQDYISDLPSDATYTYPAESGSSILRLQAFLLGEGNTPARFVFGIDHDGHRIMLRFYPSVYFFGISPENTRFSQRNSTWYMAWRMSGDVAELVVAYPLQIRAKYKNPMDMKERLDKFVDEIVAESNSINDLFL